MAAHRRVPARLPPRSRSRATGEVRGRAAERTLSSSGSESRTDHDGLLACATPPQWLHHACSHIDALLLDHASCEKKAASTAVSLLFRYPEQDAFVQRLSRLAREELRHFEQVRAVIARRGVAFRRVRPTRY